MDKPKIKNLDDFKPSYNCRFHPTDWWHEIGCPHKDWTKEELHSALRASKQSNSYLEYLLTHSIPKTRENK